MFPIYGTSVKKQIQRNILSTVKAICYSNIFDKISQEDVLKYHGVLPPNNLRNRLLPGNNKF